MTGTRGRPATPMSGITSVVPNNITERVKQLGKTQVQVVEEMNSDPVIMATLGKVKLSRGTFAYFAGGRALPSVDMLVALMIYLKCDAEDLYEPYVLTLIDKAGYPKAKHVMKDSWWEF